MYFRLQLPEWQNFLPTDYRILNWWIRSTFGLLDWCLNPGGCKEMSSILADQYRPRIWAQMLAGGGELRYLSQWVQLYTGAPMNLGDLTPSLTCTWIYRTSDSQKLSVVSSVSNPLKNWHTESTNSKKSNDSHVLLYRWEDLLNIKNNLVVVALQFLRSIWIDLLRYLK